MFLGLTNKEKNMLQYEVISSSTKLKMTRLIRVMCKSDDLDIQILKQNRFVNIARNIINWPLYVLEADDMGDYHPAEFAWHLGEIEIILRRFSTDEVVEFLGDILEGKLVDIDIVNRILSEEGSSISFLENDDENIIVNVIPIEEIEELQDPQEHPNVRKLINRLESNLADNDYPAVLHTSANIFETLAKDVVGIEAIQNQTLAGFFDRYKNESKLPEPILDYILEIYKRRNTEPTAGHGSTQQPSIQKYEAIILVEMTKAFVRLERKLTSPQVPTLVYGQRLGQ